MFKNSFQILRGTELSISLFPRWTGRRETYTLTSSLNPAGSIVPVESASDSAIVWPSILVLQIQGSVLQTLFADNLLKPTPHAEAEVNASSKLVCSAARWIGSQLSLVALIESDEGQQIVHGRDSELRLLPATQRFDGTTCCTILPTGEVLVASCTADVLTLARSSGFEKPLEIVDQVAVRRQQVLEIGRRGLSLEEPIWVSKRIFRDISPTDTADSAPVPDGPIRLETPGGMMDGSALSFAWEGAELKLVERFLGRAPETKLHLALVRSYATLLRTREGIERGAFSIGEGLVAATSMKPIRCDNVLLGPDCELSAIDTQWIANVDNLPIAEKAILLAGDDRASAIYKSVTEAEREYFREHPMTAIGGYVLGRVALDSFSGRDNESDAMRHAYWAALLTQAFGDEHAKAILDAHEAKPDNRDLKMDSFNNSVGIYVGSRFPNALPGKLKEILASYAKRGLLMHPGNPDAERNWSRHTAFKNPEAGTLAVREAREAGRDSPREGRDREGPGDQPSDREGGIFINRDRSDYPRESEGRRYENDDRAPRDNMPDPPLNIIHH